MAFGRCSGVSRLCCHSGAAERASTITMSGLRQMMSADEPARKPLFGLTKRELDVVGAIVAGLSNRDIARKFAISEDTVKHHLTNIFDKTGASTRLELALFAVHHKLVGPEVPSHGSGEFH